MNNRPSNLYYSVREKVQDEVQSSSPSRSSDKIFSNTSLTLLAQGYLWSILKLPIHICFSLVALVHV